MPFSSPNKATVGAKKKTPVLDRQNALAQYFQDMSAGGLLDAKSEAALASTLRDREEQIWQATLCYAPMVVAVSDFISEKLDEKKQVAFGSVRSASTRLRKSKSKSKKAQESLDKVAHKAAIALREQDPDQVVLVALLDEIHALVDGSDSALKPKGKLDRSQLVVYSKSIDALRRAATVTRNKFVESNLGLVVSVARRYQFSGMGLADLIQEGNLGLLKAVSRFDDRRGFRFSTYATWWIRHAIGRAVADKSRTVRVPVHVTEANQKIRKLTQELSSRLGREPTREEVAKGAEMTVRKLESTMRNAQGYSLSLDAPLGEDGDRERLEVFTTDTADSAFDKLSTLALSDRATRALDTLAPIEIEILHRRFGLAGRTATTLQEIANSVGKSRERIRQIQEKALLKLRDRLVAEHAI